MTIFTADYIERNYPSFFAYTRMDVKDTALVGIIGKAWAAKKELRKFFPFDNEGRIHIAQYDDAGEAALKAFEKTIKVIATYLYSAIDCEISAKYLPRMVVANCMESGVRKGMKVSKIMSAYELHPSHREDVIRQDLCTELPRLPLEGKANMKLIVQNFYSELAQLKKNPVSLVLSVNPIDILNASTDKVLSCNRLGNMAESAPMSAATSSRIGIARVVSESGLLLGRCYVGFSRNFLGYTFQPCYGMMGQAHVDDLIAWLQLYVDTRLIPKTTADTWKQSFAQAKVPTELLSESEHANFYTDSSGSFLYRGSIEEAQPGLHVGASYCVQCGKESPHLFCPACEADRFTTCSRCSTKVLRTAVADEANPLCPTCASLRVECHFCGKMFIKNSATSSGTCPSCISTNTQCFICGGSISILPDGDSAGSYYGGAYSPVKLVGRSVYAHNKCLNPESDNIAVCRVCGKRNALKMWGGGDCVCLGCLIANYFDTQLRRNISIIKDFYKAINSKLTTLPSTVKPSQFVKLDLLGSIKADADKAA